MCEHFIYREFPRILARYRKLLQARNFTIQYLCYYFFLLLELLLCKSALVFESKVFDHFMKHSIIVFETGQGTSVLDFKPLSHCSFDLHSSA